jgi:hypothetical protein
VKGILFTELISLVDQAFGADVTEDMIAACDLESGGAYTSVGTYSHNEFITLLDALSKNTNLPTRDLCITFGKYLFGRFAQLYPTMFTDKLPLFDFLMEVDDRIHGEVRKLYPEADLPKLDARMVTPTTLQVVYSSSRSFGDAAEGLLLGAIDYFGEEVDLARTDLPKEGEGQCVQFQLAQSKAAAA